jgi:putative flippase GtrA
MSDRLAELRSTARFGQFVSVGVVGFAFDITTSTALRELGVFPEVAVIAGIEVAIVVMFMLNDRLTFAGEGSTGIRSAVRRLARSHVVRLGGIAVQLGTFSAIYRLPGVTLTVASIDGWFVLSKATAVGVAMFVNYVAESLFTWRVGAGGG